MQSIKMTDATQSHGIGIGSWPLGAPQDSSFYCELARTVEQLGFHSLFHGDHLFAYNDNMGVLPLLGYWAAITQRIQLGTGVLLTPLREPVVAAKDLATVDLLAGGRLTVGVGIGGEIDQEWTAMEIPRAHRGLRADEHLEVMRQFWSGKPIDFRGRFRNVHGVTGSPRPCTPGGPRVVIGGRSEASLRRALRHQGWFGYAMSARKTRQMVDRLGELAGGQLPQDFRISVSLFSMISDSKEAARKHILEALHARYRQDFSNIIDSMGAFGTFEDVRETAQMYWEAGVDELVWSPHVGHQQMVEQITLLAEAFL